MNTSACQHMCESFETYDNLHLQIPKLVKNEQNDPLI
jgi:hypothetical protein